MLKLIIFKHTKSNASLNCTCNFPTMKKTDMTGMWYLSSNRHDEQLLKTVKFDLLKSSQVRSLSHLCMISLHAAVFLSWMAGWVGWGLDQKSCPFISSVCVHRCLIKVLYPQACVHFKLRFLKISYICQVENQKWYTHHPFSQCTGNMSWVTLWNRKQQTSNNAQLTHGLNLLFKLN